MLELFAQAASNNQSKAMATGRFEEEMKDGRHVFSLLRPLCVQLLQIPTGGGTDVLDSLLLLLKDVPQSGLQSCMEYLLFPLLLLLDAAVASRSSASLGGGANENSGQSRMVISDMVAEGVLSCLGVVLQRCPFQTSQQMGMVLGKLSTAAMLPASKASEEFRHGVVKCLRAALLSLQQCADPSCLCRILSLPPMYDYGDQPTSYAEYVWTASVQTTEVEEGRCIDGCPLASFQSEEMAPAIGHILSVLLEISQTEAIRGGVGSSKLRVDALFTLRALVWKVGTADALSFFLPGVVSSLFKGMGIAKTHYACSALPKTPSYTLGAGGSPGALEESIRGIAEMLVFVIGDARNGVIVFKNLFSTTSGEVDERTISPAHYADAALERLRAVSLDHRVGRVAATDSFRQNPKCENTRTTSAHNAGNQLEPNSAVADFRVERNREWIQSTASRISSVLFEVFPSLCAHPTPAIRVAVVDAAALLLQACSKTLENCTEVLLGCLLSLASDEWKQVASAACSYLAVLVSMSTESCLPSKDDIQGVLKHARLKTQRACLLHLIDRLVLKLPMAVYSSDNKVAVLHARQLAAAMYFAGPDVVASSLLNSPVSTARFIDVMSQCFSFTTAFSGAINQLTRLRSNDSNVLSMAVQDPSANTVLSASASRLGIVNISICNEVLLQQSNKSSDMGGSFEGVAVADLLPRVPPWLINKGGDQLYTHLSLILRLAGLSCGYGNADEAALSMLVEPLLATLRNFAGGSDQTTHIASWSRQPVPVSIVGFGHQIRAAATSVSLLNEIIYGASGAWTSKILDSFECLVRSTESFQEKGSRFGKTKVIRSVHFHFEDWKIVEKNSPFKYVVNLVGDILHDYMLPEIWDLLNPASLNVPTELSHHPSIVGDIVMFQQVLVEGIGVFAISLQKQFDENGFLGLVLYSLLERLGSSYYNISDAADIVLRIVCSHCGYASVKALVKLNSDHIVESLCRQLRHFSLHPSAPDLLAAILRHTGAAPDLLPLLEEPMRSLQLELEVLSRRQHPRHTVPLLRGLQEISKAADEAGRSLVSKAAKSGDLIKTTLSSLDGEQHRCVDAIKDDLENIVAEINERQRCSGSIGSVAASCILTCAPLLSAKDQQTCLLALNTVEHGISALANFQNICNLDRATYHSIEAFVKDVGGFPGLESSMGKEEPDSNTKKLLPTMHRLWPHLVICLQDSNSAVVVKALGVIACCAYHCGGVFLARRMKKDALPLLIKLLRNQPSTSTGSSLMLQKTSLAFLSQRRQRGDPQGQEFDASPVEIRKLQTAVLQCLTAIASKKESAAALDGVVGILASWIVGLGCSVTGLQDAAEEALLALSNVDADLVWILVADLAHAASASEDILGPAPESSQFLPVSTIFPPLRSTENAMWRQFTGAEEENLHVRRTVAVQFFSKLSLLGEE